MSQLDRRHFLSSLSQLALLCGVGQLGFPHIGLSQERKGVISRRRLEREVVDELEREWEDIMKKYGIELSPFEIKKRRDALLEALCLYLIEEGYTIIP